MQSYINFSKKLEMTLIEVGQKFFPNFINKKLMEKGFNPRFYKTSNAELQYLFDAKKKLHYLPITAEHIYSYHWGKGPEIILVHGWGGRGVQLYPFIETLTNLGFSVVTFDVPAHGDSNKRYTHILEFVESLQVVARSLDSVKGVIAHSMGTTSAAKVIHDFFNTHDFKFVWVAGHYNLKNYFYEWGNNRGFPDSILDNVFQAIESQFGTTIDSIQTEKIAASLKTRTLLIHDTHDKKSDLINATRLSKDLTNVEVLITQGLGHFKILKDEKVKIKIKKFFTTE